MQDLLELREGIDKVDKQIVALFEERMKLVAGVAEYKKHSGRAVLDVQREQQKLEKVGSMASNEFNRHAIQEVFTQLMTVSRRYQVATNSSEGHAEDAASINIARKLSGLLDIEALPRTPDIRVAFYGERGSHTMVAMRECFGDKVIELSYPDFMSVTNAVTNGYADFGILPIENTTTGSINDCYDLLSDGRNMIVGEHVLRIRQALVGLEDAELSDIKTVYSHEQAVLQSRQFLSEHPDIKAVPGGSTSAAAKKVKDEGDKTQAAICSELCAQEYGLKVLSPAINYESKNSTRFVIFASRKIRLKDADKLSICFRLPHKSGSLYTLLSNIIYNGLNMTHIESRPIPGRNFEYQFFVDFEGNINEPAVINTLNGIDAEASELTILGNYKTL
ncbi:MAG TPA: chorismate mutase [Lachnospiraceae bacterium]|nr:chorismate mutase [Lachnospiraceae bacterium]